MPVPPRLTPGYEKRVSPRSLFLQRRFGGGRAPRARPAPTRGSVAGEEFFQKHEVERLDDVYIESGVQGPFFVGRLSESGQRV